MPPSSTTKRAPDLAHLKDARRPVRVLMVCMGNICRSPTAHGVLQKMVDDAHLADRIQVDSAGTHDYHVGEAPDRRAQAHAARRGYDLSAQRARHLRARDFVQFDLVLLMDAVNECHARAVCPDQQRHKMHRLTDFCTQYTVDEVPDPYYGGPASFERVLDLAEDACRGLLRVLAEGDGPGAAAGA